MNPKAKHLAVLALSAGVTLPFTASATNGYFLMGYGAMARGVGGAAVAFPQDSLVAAANPAGIADLSSRFDVGMELFNPERSAWAPGLPGGKNIVKSDDHLFLLPNMGGVFQFNQKLSFGIAAVGNGGMNTRYNTNFFNLGGNEPTLGVNLAQMLITPTAAYKITPTQSVGASLVIGIQQFRAYGLSDFNSFNFSSNPAKLSNNGNDWSYGAGIRVGWLGKFLDGRLNLGATVASKVYMTRFRKYTGLFAENGNFDIPANFAVGIAFKPVQSTTLALDVERILYEGVTSIANLGPTNLAPPPAANKLGTPGGYGFGWQDMTVYKAGIATNLNRQWTVRAGYNYGHSPIPDTQLLFNTLAPGIVERHVSVGFTYRPNPSTDITFTAVHAFRRDQAAYDPATGNNVRISLAESSVELAYGMHF
ncbi:MAG: outer membrane protein transport protein [Gammaproteobacteria bacterium]